VRPYNLSKRGRAIIVTCWLNLQEKVRVIMRVPEGYTKFWSNGHFGVGIADGGIYWDIAPGSQCGISTCRLPWDNRSSG
jgi:hypothetical protein